MKNKLLLIIVTAFTLLAFPNKNFGQAPTLGSAADFALFSTAGAVTSSSSLLYLTHVTGNIGAAPASISGFGNVDGVLHQGTPQFGTASTDLLTAYAYLNTLTPTNVMATPFGGGTILTPGVHNIVNAAIWLTGDIILDAQGNPNSVFVFQLDGAFNTSANAKVKLINGALACNVFWKVEGAVTLAAGTKMMGSIIANNALISLSAGDTLEGRALSINGAVSVNEALIFLPIGCGSPVLTGPALPVLNSVECYALFSSNGPVQDDFATFVIGDIGTNLGSTLGYDPLKVTGNIHPIPDASTAQCSTDLQVVYNNLNALPYDIELLHPNLFGHNLVLTPHTYLMLAAVSFTDTLYLNAQGNPNAVFIFQINGAFTTSTYSNVVLINGAQAKNVYWKIDGAVDINDYSVFNGTIVSAGAINLLTGVVLNGRALTTVGALSTYAATVNTPTGTSGPAGNISGPISVCQGQTGIIFSVPVISGATNYNWSLPPGFTIVSGANTDSITVDVSSSASSGNVNITVQGSSFCGNGTISANYAVTINPSPTINSVSNQSICNNATTATVTFSGSVVGAVYNWTNNNTSIGLAATGSGDIVSFTGTNTGIVADSATITIIPSANGCDGFPITFTITVNPTPTVNSVSNQVLCGNSPTTTVNPTGGVVGTTYNWSNDNTSIGLAATGSGAINSFTANNTGSTPVMGTVTITPTINGCDGTPTTFTITVDPTPTVDTVSNQSLCTESSSSAITFSGGPVGTTYSWTNDNTSIGLTASGSGDINSFTTTNAGTATITVIPTANGCDGASTSFTILVEICGSVDLNVVKTVSDSMPFVGSTIVFTIVATNNGSNNATGVEVTDIIQSGYVFVSSTTTTGIFNPTTGVWTIGTLNSGASETLTVTVTVVDNGNYVNTAIIYGNETDADMVDNVSSIETYPIDFNLPEGFSPNGDGINDLFVIRGIDRYPANSFVIFNRWGNKLFEASPYQNEWDGRATTGVRVGGDELPVGTYFYVLDLGDGSDIFKGTIYLNR